MANSKVTGTEYKSIADAYGTIYDSLVGIEDQAKLGVEAIVNIQKASHWAITGDEDSALNAELTLLEPTNGAYLSSQNVAASTSNYLSAIRALNNLVIEGADAGATDTAKLADFVNGEVSWDGGCVPSGWASFCELAGYDTATWTVCS